MIQRVKGNKFTVRASGTQEVHWKLGTQGGSQGSSIQNEQAKKKKKRRSRKRTEGSGRQQVATIRLRGPHQEGFHSTDGSWSFLLELQPGIDKAWILVKQTLTLVELIIFDAHILTRSHQLLCFKYLWTTNRRKMDGIPLTPGHILKSVRNLTKKKTFISLHRPFQRGTCATVWCVFPGGGFI